MSYFRPKNETEISQTIKKSLFIGQSSIVTSPADAIAFMQQIKSEHKSANHSCHCFIAGTPRESSLWGYSDDGEPKGTAGIPMFNVIKHSGLGNICIVVTRYFGGIKLGTGGIARAYSSSVNLVLNDTDSELVHLTCRKTLSVPFHLTGMIEHQLKKFSRVYVIERVWFDKGLDLILELEEPSVADFLAALSPYQHELSIAALS